MAKKIMIIDDAAETLALLEAVFQGQGYATMASPSAEDAMLKLRNDHPDLIVLDVLMPEIDGFAFFKVLKKERSTSSIPVLVLTVRTRMEDTFRALGVEEFLGKPFDTQKLLEKVTAILGGDANIDVSSAEVQEISVAQNASVQTSTAATMVVEEPSTAGTTVAAKKILAFSSSESIATRIKNSLVPFNPVVEVVVQAAQAATAVQSFKPDIIVVEARLNDSSAADIIAKVKRIKLAANKPVVVLYASEQSVSGYQKTLAMDIARTACLKMGASDVIGDFAEDRFVTVIQKYL